MVECLIIVQNTRSDSIRKVEGVFDMNESRDELCPHFEECAELEATLNNAVPTIEKEFVGKDERSIMTTEFESYASKVCEDQV